VSRYRVIIGGADRTNYVRVGAPSGPGIGLDQSIGARSLASFTTLDRAGVWAPVFGQTVAIWDDAISPARLLFSGRVDRSTVRHIQGADALEAQVSCADASAIVETIVVIEFFPIGTYGMLHNVAAALTATYLGAQGYTFDSVNSINAYVGEITFSGVSLKTAFDTLAQIAACSWVITTDKVVKFFTLASGAVANPLAITDAAENYVSASITRTSSDFANRVYATSTIPITSDWTDTWTGNGWQTMFATLYSLAAAPVVKVNGVTQTVIESALLNTSPQPAYDWFWIAGGLGVFQNPADSPLTSGDTLTVTYPSPVGYVAMAESPYSQEAYGLIEKIVPNVYAEDQAALDAAAAAELDRVIVDTSKAEIVTREDGFEAGQIVTVDIAKPLISGTFMIENMTARELAQDAMEYTLRLSPKVVNRVSTRANPAEYIGRLINGPDEVGDGTDATGAAEIITFILAGTIEGLTNPGLTAGVKEALKVVQVGGMLRSVSLRWGTPPVDTTEVDVLLNGTSIFTARAVQTPSGSFTDTVQRFDGWSPTPFAVAAGDVFTIQVLVADATAMDGSLDIVLV
jgi:hypothetical protein